MASSRSKWSSFAAVKQKSMFTATMMAVSTSRSGASVTTVTMLAGAPMTKRKR